MTSCHFPLLAIALLSSSLLLFENVVAFSTVPLPLVPPSTGRLLSPPAVLLSHQKKNHHRGVVESGRPFLEKATTTTTTSVLKSSSGSGDTEIARPDPSVLLSAKSDSEQRKGVLFIGAGLLAGTFVLSTVLGWLDALTGGFLGTILRFTVPLPLGLLFAFVGGTHFFYKKEYAAVVPPSGTWGGLWNVPAPGAENLGFSDEDYHVIWSGVAEVGGGLLLALGAFNAIPVQIPAFLLFLLTLAVTPANIYMYTHDVPLAFAPPLRYPDDHIARGVLQIILLSLFWFLITH